MFFARRDGRPATRFVVIRVGLLFFAAGLWLAGVVIGSDGVTYVAIGVLAVAILLGALARRGGGQLEADE